MKPKVLAAIVWGAVALWVLVANADFGSFRMDQPFLAGSSGPCSGITFPYDSMQSYSNMSYLGGLAGGCNWPEAYDDHPMTNLPALFHLDSMSTYTNGATLNGLIGWDQIAPWTNGAYADHDATNTTFTLLLAKAAHRWMSSDYAVGDTVVSWTNKIGTINFTNGDASKRPTNTATGIWVSDVFYLSNTAVDVKWPTAAVFVVYAPNQSPDTYSTFWVNDNGGFEHGIYTQTRTLKVGAIGTLYGPSSVIASNELTDSIITGTMVGGNYFRFFTNGLYAEAGNNGCSTYSLKHLAKRAQYTKAYLREIIVYTNSLFSEDAYALHQYRTNTYGGTP